MVLVTENEIAYRAKWEYLISPHIWKKYMKVIVLEFKLSNSLLQ